VLIQFGAVGLVVEVDVEVGLVTELGFAMLASCCCAARAVAQ